MTEEALNYGNLVLGWKLLICNLASRQGKVLEWKKSNTVVQRKKEVRMNAIAIRDRLTQCSRQGVLKEMLVLWPPP